MGVTLVIVSVVFLLIFLLQRMMLAEAVDKRKYAEIRAKEIKEQKERVFHYLKEAEQKITLLEGKINDLQKNYNNLLEEVEGDLEVYEETLNFFEGRVGHDKDARVRALAKLYEVRQERDSLIVEVKALIEMLETIDKKMDEQAKQIENVQNLTQESHRLVSQNRMLNFEIESQQLEIAFLEEKHARQEDEIVYLDGKLTVTEDEAQANQTVLAEIRRLLG